MEESQKIKAIILNSTLDIQDRINQLESNYSYHELNTIKIGKRNWNIVTYASRHGDLAILKYLINRFKTLLDPAGNEMGGSILHHAAAKNSYEVFQYLWESFPQFREIKDFKDYTLAHYAAVSDNENTTVIKFLYQMQPKTFDMLSIHYHMPIHLAAQHGNPETIRTLAKYYQKTEDLAKDLDELFAGRDNPLHHAIKLNRVDNVRSFLALGMSLEKANKSGLLPVHLAAKYGSLEILKYLRQEKQVDLQRVTNNEYKVQPIHFAVLYNHLPVVEWLVEQGINIYDSTLSGNSLIHLAAYRNNATIINWLIQRGVPYDTPNSELRTIVHIISDNANLTPLRELEAYPFNYSSYDSEGYSPFHSACRHLASYAHRILLAVMAKVIIENSPMWFPLEEVKMCRTNFWQRDNLIALIEDTVTEAKFDQNAGRKTLSTENSTSNDASNENILYFEELIDFYISKGCLLEQTTNNEAADFAVHVAAEFNNVDILKALAKKNLPLHCLNAKKQSPIELAVSNGSLNVLEYLLENINHLLLPYEWHKLLCIALANRKYHTLNVLLKKQTPYYAASSAQLHQRNEYGFYLQHVLTKTLSTIDEKNIESVTKIVELLIYQHKVDVNYQDSEGNTLLNLFCSLNFSEFKDIQPILKLLLDNGSYPYFPNTNNKFPFDQLIEKIGYSSKDFKLVYNFMQEYGIRTGALPVFFSTIRADQKSITRYIKYYPKYYLAELANTESKPNFLKTAFIQENIAEIKLLLRFGFAIGYHFTEAEWHLLNSHPEFEFTFLAIGSKLLTAQGCFDLEQLDIKPARAIFTVEDINLVTLDSKTRLNWTRIIKVILVNSSAFQLTERQFESLLNIFFLLVSNFPAMNIKILSLVRTAIDELRLYPDKSEDILLRNQKLLSLLYQFYNNLYFAHIKDFPKLGYLCINSLLIAEDCKVSEPVVRTYIKNTFELCAHNNNEVKRNLWCLFGKFSLFPTAAATVTANDYLNTNEINESRLSK